MNETPMEAIFGMDDLTRYIIEHYSNLMTLQEQLASRSIQADAEAQIPRSASMQAAIRRLLVSDDPQVQELLRDGSRAFFENTRDRILRDHAGELNLNHCPRCGALARTPRAKQCPKCFYSWHEAA